MPKAYKDLTKANTDYQKLRLIYQKNQQNKILVQNGIGGALDSAKNKTEELDNKTAELCNHAESNLARYRKELLIIGNAWERELKIKLEGAISLVATIFSCGLGAGFNTNPGYITKITTYFLLATTTTNLYIFKSNSSGEIYNKLITN